MGTVAQWTMRLLRATVIGVALGVILSVGNALHITRRPQPLAEAAEAVSRETGSSWSDVHVSALDGARLSGWFFKPIKPNGSAVILLHGVGDTRLGTLAHAAFLLQEGFSILTPDLRGHGASGGELITYGLKEASDVHTWSNWLFQNQHAQRLYGLGESLGAAVLLQSIPKEPRFRAVVAECPFATFEEVASDRMHQFSRMPRPIFWPVVRFGFLYACMRYGLDFWQASPAAAIRSTAVPVLLIHGARDTNIPPYHSEELHALNPKATQLWEIPGAEHVAGLSQEPEAYPRKVIAWFTTHR